MPNKSPWLGMLFGGLLAAGLSGGFEDTRKHDEPKPAEGRAEAPAKQENPQTRKITVVVECPLELLAEGDRRSGFQYTLQLKRKYCDLYLRAYKEIRVKATSPETKLYFNEVYRIADGVRERWRPMDETAMRVVGVDGRWIWKNTPTNALFEVYGIKDGKERMLFRDYSSIADVRTFSLPQKR